MLDTLVLAEWIVLTRRLPHIGARPWCPQGTIPRRVWLGKVCVRPRSVPLWMWRKGIELGGIVVHPRRRSTVPRSGLMSCFLPGMRRSSTARFKGPSAWIIVVRRSRVSVVVLLVRVRWANAERPIIGPPSVSGEEGDVVSVHAPIA